MEEPYNFSPVDLWKTSGKKGDWENADLKDWDWLCFYNYFLFVKDQKYGTIHWVTMKEKGKKKNVIEQSFAFWGKETFKAMIDWLVENYREYPEWKELHIGLVCGTHGWAKMIAEQAARKLELDKHRNGE